MPNLCISAPHLQRGRYPQVMCLSYTSQGKPALQLNSGNWKMVVEQWRLISCMSHSNCALSCQFLLSSDCIPSMV